MRDRPYRCSDLTIGAHIRWRNLPWRIDRVDAIDEANWSDEERDAISAYKLKRLEAQRSGGYVYDENLENFQPYRIKLDPIEGFDHPAYAEHVNAKGYVILRGAGRFGYRWDPYDTTGAFHDWDYLPNWPHEPVCHDCGFLWPCPDHLMTDAIARAERDARRRICARCGRHLDHGRMAACVGEDGNPDTPGAVWYCGRKGACLTAAHKAANERGLRLIRRHQWGNWVSIPAAEV